MQCRQDKQKLIELFEQDEFQNLSIQTQKVIAVHLGIKKLKNKVMEESVEMCKAYRELVKDLKREGRLDGLRYAVSNLMEASQLTLEQAMDILKITGEERAKLMNSD